MIISLFVLTNTFAKAQNVKFRSPVIESYIKSHVGIEQTDELNTSQLDTITHVDLSGLDLTDISDVKFLTNVRSLDLSNNRIENIAPLATLDSLCEVNLSHNNLKSVSMLSFSYAKKMYANIAFNYIKDFSCFNTLTNCYFTIAGANMQYDKDDSFFDVDYLVCNNKLDKPVVTCRVNSNSGNRTTLRCLDEEFEVPTDRSQFKCELKSDVTSASPIYLANGDDVYSTYIVPVNYYDVDAGNTITIEPGLPESYSLSAVHANYGTVVIEGNAIKYTAPDKAVSDFIDFSYFQGSTLKGISRYYVNMDKGNKGDVNNDGSVNALDLKLLVDALLAGEKPSKVTDINEDGQLTIGDVTSLISLLEHHEYVDLGLPSGTLWATCNIGAATPEDYGSYFAWGETEIKESYSQDTFMQIDLGRNISGTNYDAAYTKWGSDWCMPTKEDFDELMDNCTHTWTTVNDVNGLLFTSSNGNSVFLPAAGRKCGSEIWDANQNGFYRGATCTPHYLTGYRAEDYPDFFLLVDDEWAQLWSDYGASIRPVIHSSNILDNSLAVTQTELDFDLVAVGTNKTKTFKVVNTKSNNVTFHISSDRQFTDFFEVKDSEGEFTLAPGEFKEFVVTSHGLPSGHIAKTSIIVVSHDDNQEQKVMVKSYGWDSLFESFPETMVVGETVTIPIKSGDFTFECLARLSSEYLVSNMIIDAERGGDSGGQRRTRWDDSRYLYSSCNLIIKAVKEGTGAIRLKDNITGKVYWRNIMVQSGG